MDILNGFEAQNYLSGALHVAKSSPRSVLVKDPNKDLFESIQDRNDKRAEEMARRRGSSRVGSFGGGDVFAGIPRMYTPMDYFQSQKIPHDINNDMHRFELYK